MRLRAFLLLCGMILTSGSVLHNSAQAKQARKLQEFILEAPLPVVVDLLLVGPHGQILKLAPISGHPYLLHLWATWCSSCRVELPHLASFLQKHPDAPVIPLVMSSGSPVKVAAFLEHLGMKDFPVWIADRQKLVEIVSHASEPGLPMTFLVDGEGHIRAISNGDVDWAADDARTQLQVLLSRVEGKAHEEAP